MNILELSDDLQWRILRWSADISALEYPGTSWGPEPSNEERRLTYSPLTIIRRSSQVCRSWRQLLLNSPSIWGRVLHLDCLALGTADWRLEVLARTGQSPLCILGEVIGVTMEDFFFSLLDDNWSRIRKIKVRIHCERELEDKLWEPLTRPTSVLESFNLSLSGETSFPSKFKTKLFGNNAPSLVEFHPNDIQFSLQAPWVSQLRCLEVSQPSTVQEVIEATRQMPLLDTLFIGHEVMPMTTPVLDTRQVFLPGLTSIKLICLFETAVQFLERVSPSKGCDLSFRTSNRLPIQEHELEASCQVLIQYANSHFSAHPPKGLSLRVNHRFFYVHRLLDPGIRSASSLGRLDIKIDLRSSPSWSKPIFFRILASSVSSSTMREVTTLDFHMDSIDPPNADIMRTMYSFTSLEVLILAELNLLSQIQTLVSKHRSDASSMNTDPLFPRLRTLEIAQSRQIPADVLQSFLSWREMIGVPIQTLDLTSSRLALFGDLGFLEKFHMKVIWSAAPGSDKRIYTTQEYVCPGGDPSRLDFRDPRSW